MVQRWARGFAVALIVILIVAAPLGYARYCHVNYRNVRTVVPAVLYRSGQLTRVGLERVVHEYGIRTVVSLRDSDKLDDRTPDAAEEEFCRNRGISHVRIGPKSWWPQYDGPPPAEQGVATFLYVMDDANNHPVLLHCFAGTHRTGAMVAIYRMEFQGWSNAEALDELRGAGYVNLNNELDVLTYLENYRPSRTRGDYRFRCSFGYDNWPRQMSGTLTQGR